MKKRSVGDTFKDLAGNLCTVRENGTLSVTTLNEEPSLTLQSEKDSCDINKILAKFKTTGLMTNVRQSPPINGDYSISFDYHSSMNQILAAQEAFAVLPPALRKRFDNDPGSLLSFLDDPANRAEAIQLGLLEAPPQDSQIPQGGAVNVKPPVEGG